MQIGSRESLSTLLISQKWSFVPYYIAAFVLNDDFPHDFAGI